MMQKLIMWWLVIVLVILAGCEMATNAPAQEIIAEEIVETEEIPEPETIIITSEPVEEEIVEDVREPLPSFDPDPEPELEVHYIDVGQGDSTLIILPNKETVLIDCGDEGKGSELIAYFASIGVKNIDLLIGTHSDPEHIGGCSEIMNNFPVAKVMENGQYQHHDAYLNFRESARQRQYKVLKEDLYDYDLDSTVNIDILTPYSRYYKFDQYVNDNSVSVVMTYGLYNFLFTGDCEFRCEDSLMKQISGEIFFYKVGNHGSKTSTTPRFLSVIRPKISIVSAGADNEEGYPHKETLTRLRQYRSKIFSTIDEGTIVVTAQARDYRMSTD